MAVETLDDEVVVSIPIAGEFRADFLGPLEAKIEVSVLMLGGRLSCSDLILLSSFCSYCQGSAGALNPT